MIKISIGEKASAVIDEDNHAYTWGTLRSHNGWKGSSVVDDGNKMPTLVESLATKVVNQVAVGLEFIVALGQDFDENGLPINS